MAQKHQQAAMRMPWASTLFQPCDLVIYPQTPLQAWQWWWMQQVRALLCLAREWRLMYAEAAL